MNELMDAEKPMRIQSGGQVSLLQPIIIQVLDWIEEMTPNIIIWQTYTGILSDKKMSHFMLDNAILTLTLTLTLLSIFLVAHLCGVLMMGALTDLCGART